MTRFLKLILIQYTLGNTGDYSYPLSLPLSDALDGSFKSDEGSTYIMQSSGVYLMQSEGVRIIQPKN